MSKDWVKDIADMHNKYGVNKWVRDPKNKEKLKDFIIPEPKKAKKVSDEEKEVENAEG